MAYSCDNVNESLFPYQAENFSIHLATTIFQGDLFSMSKLSTLNEASYISPEQQVTLMSSLKVQQRLWCSPAILIKKYRVFLPGGKNGRSVNLITQLKVMPCLKLRESVFLIPHTSSHVCMDLLFNACTYCQWGTRWRSWLRHCATSRKVAGSIPNGVIGIFH